MLIRVLIAIAASSMALAAPQSPPPDEQHPAEWTARPLVGVILEINDDGLLRIQVGEQVDELVHVRGEGMVATGHHDVWLGVRLYRFAGVKGVRPRQTNLQSLRDWLVDKNVRLYIGKSFSEDTYPEPVPAVIHERDGDTLLNDQVIQRGLGELWGDEPGALGGYDWDRMLKAARAASHAP